MQSVRLYIILILLCCLTGCARFLYCPDSVEGHYYLSPHQSLSAINRVALIELEHYPGHSELSETLTQSLADGLGKKHLFTVKTVYRSDPEWTMLDLDNITTYSHQDLVNIREVLNVDAIIFGSIKHYQPFPHLLVSLHLKMIDAYQADLVWAMEQVWDSSDKQVEMRMKEYYQSRFHDSFKPLDWKILVTSPRAFNKFVADEVGDTFPKPSEILY